MEQQQVDLTGLLRQGGYRMTPQRQLVLEAVSEIGGHSSPEQIYAAVSERSTAVNKATVYRVLKFLVELGLLTATFSADGRMEYELASSHGHHHLVCRICGRNQEFQDHGYVGLVRSLEDSFGFEVESNHVTLTGLCQDCRRET